MLNLDIPLHILQNDFLTNKCINIYVLRLDLIHPQISGNKWFKLKYNLDHALKENYSTILTFGGAYSNHIVATAVASNFFGLKSIGIIRGEINDPLNERLAIAVENGMQLHYVSRSDYKQKFEKSFIQDLKNKFGEFYYIEEGGANELGIKGCSEIMGIAKKAALNSFNKEIKFDYIFCACGTGTTIKGIIQSLEPNEKVIGVPVLKITTALTSEINRFLEKSIINVPFNNWGLIDGYHFGGYAKKSNELDDFILTFIEDFKMNIEFVYTGKLFYAIFDKIDKGFFEPNQNILVLHSGGIF